MNFACDLNCEVVERLREADHDALGLGAVAGPDDELKLGKRAWGA
jgi:hypothetical protein